jgi:hypothetical protein
VTTLLGRCDFLTRGESRRVSGARRHQERR